ncbi:hypothetical protein B566_EDAN002393 [Ephemera danica]|nr:hypothetical protein B566_EDAN002393 [Ephemera danica]
MTMEDEEMRMLGSRKGRSASICAPGFSSMENVVVGSAPSSAGVMSSATDGTPARTRRAKPATRSQSARISAGANKPKVTRKTRGESPSFSAQSMSYRSEPRLDQQIPTIATSNVSDSPGSYRRSIKAGGARRVNSVKGTASSHHRGESMYHRKQQGGYLDVPGQESKRGEDEDEESYRLREFSLTSKVLYGSYHRMQNNE